MDDFEEFREDLVFAFLLIAAGAHSETSHDQYETAKDFKEAICKGTFKFTADEGLRTQLAKVLKQDKTKWTDK